MRPRVPIQRDRAESRTAPHRSRPTAGSPGVSVDRIAALQRAAGNAAVLRQLAEARHVHGAGCGHQPSVPTQRSSVPDVLRSPGRPLDAMVRGDMEARLGADFSGVRLHTGIAAQRSATEIGARAYTAGSHIVVGAGGADRHTLAHELTHVIQQRQGPVAGTADGTGLRISDPSDRFEREAEANAARAMRPGAVSADGARPAATEPPRRGGLAQSVQRALNEAGGSRGSGLGNMINASIGVFRLLSDDPAPQPSRKMAVNHIANVLKDSGQESEETVGSAVMTAIGAIEAVAGEKGARDIHTVFTRPDLSELYRIPANDPSAANAHRAIADQELAYWNREHAKKPSVGTGVAVNVNADTRVKLQKTLGTAVQWSEAFRKAAAQAGNQFE